MQKQRRTGGIMRAGIAMLLAGYVLSQFYRAFLAVLTPFLERDVGTTAADLSLSSGLWFLAFAAMQIPVGAALDSIGPRRTAAWLLGLGGGGGALLFASAGDPLTIHLAMMLIGVGCSPVLMSSYYIFARTYPAAVFATLAGAMIGAGSFGNLASAWPLAWAAETFGWRVAVLGVGGMTVIVALAIWRFVTDPPRLEFSGTGESVLSLLRMPALWLILPMMLVNYAPAAGIRGLWVGPYFSDVFGATASDIGIATLVMGIAMILGNFAYGPMDRIVGSRKWVVQTGNLLSASCLLALWAFPMSGELTAILLLAAVGFFGASFPVIMAHGRSFFPPHMVGRGVSLLNLFGIGGTGLFQLLSGRVHASAVAGGATPVEAYGLLFLFFALIALAGSAIYLFSQDRTD